MATSTLTDLMGWASRPLVDGVGEVTTATTRKNL